jgi:hypothetical protein
MGQRRLVYRKEQQRLKKKKQKEPANRAYFLEDTVDMRHRLLEEMPRAL